MFQKGRCDQRCHILRRSWGQSEPRNGFGFGTVNVLVVLAGTVSAVWGAGEPRGAKARMNNSHTRFSREGDEAGSSYNEMGPRKSLDPLFEDKGAETSPRVGDP